MSFAHVCGEIGLSPKLKRCGLGCLRFCGEKVLLEFVLHEEVPWNLDVPFTDSNGSRVSYSFSL